MSKLINQIDNFKKDKSPREKKRINSQTIASRTLASLMVNLSYVPLQDNFLPALQFLQKSLNPMWDR